jgi:hypothetical protein
MAGVAAHVARIGEPRVPGGTGRSSAMADNEALVLKALKKAGQPVRPGDLAEATGLAKEDLAKVLDALKKKGKIHSPKRCFYAPVE